jgi:hypothetical protein
MAAAPLRFIGAVAWPLTIWTSLTKLENHPADDYVERTSPIVATAVAFWLCFIALIVFANPVVTAIGGSVDGGEVVQQFVRRVPGSIVGGGGGGCFTSSASGCSPRATKRFREASST